VGGVLLGTRGAVAEIPVPTGYLDARVLHGVQSGKVGELDGKGRRPGDHVRVELGLQDLHRVGNGAQCHHIGHHPGVGVVAELDCIDPRIEVIIAQGIDEIRLPLVDLHDRRSTGVIDGVFRVARIEGGRVPGGKDRVVTGVVHNEGPRRLVRPRACGMVLVVVAKVYIFSHVPSAGYLAERPGAGEIAPVEVRVGVDDEILRVRRGVGFGARGGEPGRSGGIGKSFQPGSICKLDPVDGGIAGYLVGEIIVVGWTTLQEGVGHDAARAVLVNGQPVRVCLAVLDAVDLYRYHVGREVGEPVVIDVPDRRYLLGPDLFYRGKGGPKTEVGMPVEYDMGPFLFEGGRHRFRVGDGVDVDCPPPNGVLIDPDAIVLIGAHTLKERVRVGYEKGVLSVAVTEVDVLAGADKIDVLRHGFRARTHGIGHRQRDGVGARDRVSVDRVLRGARRTVAEAPEP